MSKKNSEVRTTHFVLPNETNHYGTLFGGIALQYMDAVAFMAATRKFRKIFVTASSEKIDFKIPVKVGQMIELIGKVIKKGRTSCTVQVEMFSEELLTGKRKLCTMGNFVMVSVDKNGRPKQITP